jgi:hypothetical protein
MESLQQISNKIKPFSLSYFLAFLMISSVISCESCRNHKPNTNNPKLTLSTEKEQYQGNDDLQVELLIAHKDKDVNQPAIYNNFNLKITVTQEGGTDGSSVEYESFDTSVTGSKKETVSIIEKLTHLFKVAGTDLISPTEPLKKIFTIKPKGNPTKITVKYELLDAANNDEPLDKHTITWIPSTTPTWQFELIGADLTTRTKTIAGATEIEVKISKEKNAELIAEEVKELKLHIKRITPGNATIEGVSNGVFELKDSNTFTLATDKKSATKKLTINPGTDKKANFEIQLQDKTGNNLATTQKVIWENGAQLELVNITYEVKNHQATVTIKNNGKLKLEANHAKLSWDTGNDTVTIDGNRKSSKDIQALDLDKTILIELKNINFADPTNVPSTTLSLSLVWDQLETSIQKNSLLTAVPIDITVSKLEFNKATNQIIYSVSNNEHEDITLQVQCINTKTASGNAAIIITPLPINLNLEKAGNVKSKTGNQTLQVDFQGEDAADFKFELLFGGHPINFKFAATDVENEINQSIVTCEAKQVKLKIMVDLGGIFTSGMARTLQGDNKEVVFKIMLNGNINDVVSLEDIDKSRLKLVIYKVNTTDAEMLHFGTYYNLEPITEIPGANLTLGGNNFLTIQRANDNKADFILKLMYDKKGNGNFAEELATLPVSWEEDKFEIVVKTPTQTGELIDHEEGSFTLKNTTGAINPANITIEVQSNNHAQFGCIDKKKKAPNLPNSPTISFQQSLQELLGNNTAILQNTETEEIKFGLLNRNREKGSKVTIIVRKDGYEVARTTEPIKWRVKKIDIKIDSIKVDGIPITGNILIDEGSSTDITKAFTITLKNNGDDISTDDILIELTNSDDIEFKLGNITGAILDDLTTLLNLPSAKNFKKNTSEEISLAIANGNGTLLTDVILSLISPIKLKKNLIWINNTDTGLQRFINEAKELKKEFEKNVNKFDTDLIKVQGIDIASDSEELYNTLYVNMLNGYQEDEDIADNKNFIQHFGMDQLLDFLQDMVTSLAKINTQVVSTNKQPIKEVQEAYKSVNDIYTVLKNELKEKATVFAQKLLTTIEHYMRNADVDNKPTGDEAAKAFDSVFDELSHTLTMLSRSLSTKYYSDEGNNYPFNLTIKQSQSIFAKKLRIISKKYESEGNKEQADTCEESAKTWE